MTQYKGISKVELEGHHGQLVHHICAGVGGSSSRRQEVTELVKGMLKMDLDEEGPARKGTGKVTPDEFEQVMDTLSKSGAVHAHELADMRRRAQKALSN